MGNHYITIDFFTIINALPMQLNIEIVNPTDFIKTTLTGELDINSSKKVLTDIADSSNQNNLRPILIDLRKTTSVLNKVDLFELGTGLMEYGIAYRKKTALLTRDDDSFERANFFELVARNRGYFVKSFTNFEEAIMWLVDIKDDVTDIKLSSS